MIHNLAQQLLTGYLPLIGLLLHTSINVKIKRRIPLYHTIPLIFIPFSLLLLTTTNKISPTPLGSFIYLLPDLSLLLIIPLMIRFKMRWYGYQIYLIILSYIYVRWFGVEKPLCYGTLLFDSPAIIITLLLFLVSAILVYQKKEQLLLHLFPMMLLIKLNHPIILWGILLCYSFPALFQKQILLKIHLILLSLFTLLLILLSKETTLYNINILKSTLNRSWLYMILTAIVLIIPVAILHDRKEVTPILLPPFLLLAIRLIFRYDLTHLTIPVNNITVIISLIIIIMISTLLFKMKLLKEGLLYCTILIPLLLPLSYAMTTIIALTLIHFPFRYRYSVLFIPPLGYFLIDQITLIQ